MPGSNCETQGRFCDGLGNNIVVQHSIGLIITIHDQITAREYVDRLGNQVHPVIQKLLLNNFAVVQDGNAPIHRAGTVHSRFEEHEEHEPQHLP
jgi:hypothetical protein